MRKRTQAREIALQALYQHDLRRKHDKEATATVDDFEDFIAQQASDPEVRGYARVILDGTLASLDDLDRKIAAVAQNWKLNRIAPVDRCILRIALHEIFESPDVPPKVAINEAIDLAKKFSTEGSGAFVNGILDRIYNDLLKATGGSEAPPA
jgi:transcription antitermination factor NusB